MIPFETLTQRWESISSVPIYVGTVPEGTQAPYANLNVLQSNPVRSTSNVVSYTESIVQFITVSYKLVEAQALGEVGLQAFDQFSNQSSVLDMVYMNQSFEYLSRPGLTGNRPWSSIQEFRLRS